MNQVYNQEHPFIPVILSGGAGARLWPISRQLHPKPFMKMPDGESLLQKAFKHAISMPNVTEVLTVTNNEFYFKSEEEYKTVNHIKVPTAYILEPEGKNTAAAIAAATLYAAKKYGPDALLLILTADHLIGNPQAFQNAVLEAIPLAQQDKIVTFGITPTSPETGYGYIEFDQNDVKRFVEKPSKELAEEYIASGNYLWNAGLFCFQAQHMLKEFEQHAPDILSAIQQCLEASQLAESPDHHFSEIQLDAQLFHPVPNNSIDYAIMEKSSHVAVVPCNILWTDVGNWNALGELKDVDSNANSVIGEALLHDVSNCYIHSDNRIIGAVGVNNLIIVDTPDALLVAHKKCSQDVKHIVEKLKDSGHQAYKLHTTIHKPWGTSTTLEEEANSVIRRLTIYPEKILDYETDQDECWVIMGGSGHVMNKLMNTGDSIKIQAGKSYIVKNSEGHNLIILSAQTMPLSPESNTMRVQNESMDTMTF